MVQKALSVDKEVRGSRSILFCFCGFLCDQGLQYSLESLYSAAAA
jgi:hypothetical protein